MSASEKSEQNPFPWTGPYAVPDYPDLPQTDDPDLPQTDDPAMEDGYEREGAGEPAPLAEPLARKARTVIRAARDQGSGLWTAGRARPARAGAAVVVAAGALALAYARGRKTGRRAARRGLGPVALFFERRP
ncbi:hypothetical protein [Streptomyces griseus]|uniref:hypothetical protein n=1 Tax=Streptomyces griseus TaxID=1911 RepID=UPI0004C560B0|nr:hypothetical protein [Streptomyces griseus]